MKLFSACLGLVLAAWALPATSAPIKSGDAAVSALLCRQFSMELTGADARRSIRGTKSLWTQLSLQKPEKSPAMDSLEADLRLTDMEGLLRSAGFKIMDPKKRSLALGLRPTLVLSVYYIPSAAGAGDKDLYLVTARATQDVVPLGGSTLSMTTWMQRGEAIESTGDIHKDIDAIRASARDCVNAFISAAQDKDPEAAAPKP